jgi:competence protein ComEA
MKKIIVYIAMASLAAFVFNGIAFGAPQSIEQAQKVEEKVNVNTAGVKDLTKLPGIGTKTAQNIIDYRQQHEPFQTPKDLLKVKGIGKKTLKKVENLISFI